MAEPLVLIANYVFDGVPTDLLRFQGGEVQRGLVSLQAPSGLGAADPADRLGSLQLSYSSEPMPAEPYGDPGLDQLLADYQHVLADGPDAWMLFPAPALLALNRLGSLSQQGLLLLSADKGHKIGRAHV